MATRKIEPADRLEHIKKLVILAMFSDDQLEDLLVLKGGNAIDIVHRLGTRASVDVDFSMAADLPEALPAFRNRLEDVLQRTFRPEGYEPFDIRLTPHPERVTPELAKFWGGYNAEFKLIDLEVMERCSGDVEAMRRAAIRLGEGTKFKIEISRHEYIDPKELAYLDGYRVFVYTADMIVCEKLRAICQQMPEYATIVRRARPSTPRARDFLDIHTMVTARGVDVSAAANQALIRNIFEAKRVPLSLLGRIHQYREFHRTDFPSVIATMRPGNKTEEFDFYFDFVLGNVAGLKSLWDV